MTKHRVAEYSVYGVSCFAPCHAETLYFVTLQFYHPVTDYPHLHRKLVVDGFVAEVVEERVGTVADAVLGAVYDYFSIDFQCVVFLVDRYWKAHHVSNALDGHVAYHAILVGGYCWFYAGDGKNCRWMAGHIEKIGRLELAYQLLVIAFVGQVKIDQARHVDGECAANEPVAAYE